MFEPHFCDLIISKNQTPPFGLKFEGFKNSFYGFHIDNERFLIPKTGDIKAKGRNFIEFCNIKREIFLIEEILSEENQILELLPQDFVDYKTIYPINFRKIKINVSMPEIRVSQNMIGNLRGAVSYFPIILDEDRYYPLLIMEKLSMQVIFENVDKTFGEILKKRIEYRIREIGRNLNILTQGKIKNKILKPENAPFKIKCEEGIVYSEVKLINLEDVLEFDN